MLRRKWVFYETRIELCRGTPDKRGNVRTIIYVPKIDVFFNVGNHFALNDNQNDLGAIQNYLNEPLNTLVSYCHFEGSFNVSLQAASTMK